MKRIVLFGFAETPKLARIVISAFNVELTFDNSYFQI